MRKLLLFDKYHITIRGLLHAEEGSAYPCTYPPTAPSAPLFTADKPWESGQINWSTMRIEDGKMRLWYEAMDASSSHDCETRLCYAESADGIHWIKPNLGLCEYNSSKDNNIVIDNSIVNGIGLHGHSIYVDPNATAMSKYRCMFLSLLPRPDGGQITVMSHAYSPDGLRWTHGLPELPKDYNNFPITSFGSDTQCAVFWDDSLRKYVGYFRTLKPDGNRCIGRSETIDQTSWPQPKTILYPDYSDPPLTDYYNNGATYITNDGDRAYYLFYSMFDHNTEKCWPRVATSRDGVIFDRGDRADYIKNERAYDNGMIFISGGIHDLGNGECGVLANCTQLRHCDPNSTEAAHGPVLYRFPTDRIVGLKTESFYNFAVLGKVDPSHPEVYVNAVVNGRLRAGLIHDEKYLEGFSPDDCEPLSGDLRNATFRWRGTTAPVSEASIKLFLEDGCIFSVTVNQ